MLCCMLGLNLHAQPARLAHHMCMKLGADVDVHSEQYESLCTVVPAYLLLVLDLLRHGAVNWDSSCTVSSCSGHRLAQLADLLAQLQHAWSSAGGEGLYQCASPQASTCQKCRRAGASQARRPPTSHLARPLPLVAQVTSVQRATEQEEHDRRMNQRCGAPLQKTVLASSGHGGGHVQEHQGRGQQRCSGKALQGLLRSILGLGCTAHGQGATRDAHRAEAPGLAGALARHTLLRGDR